MYLKFDNQEDVLVVYMMGELDHHTVEEVRNKIDDRLDREKINKLVMDFNNVSFMDSSGIGMVIGRYKKLNNSSGAMVLSNVNGSVKRVFELSGLFKILKVYDSTEEAIKRV